MGLKQIALLMSLSLLSACNAAMSELPLFSGDQRSKSLRLENGLWYEVDADCVVPIANAKEQWPKCATWAIVKDNKIVRWNDSDSTGLPLDIFIVEGRPPLIQHQIDTEKPKYGYLALDPSEVFAGRKLVTLRTWSVPCGTDDPATGKVDPYPGFNKDCMTISANAVRAASAKLDTTKKAVLEWRWVRAEN